MKVWLLPFVMLALILLRAQYKRSSRTNNNKKEDFLKREQEANFTRKQDISTLEYITIPVESLPFIDTDIGEINKYQTMLKSLADDKIINLQDKSSTDLKLQYGSANLPLLTQYENNYTTMLRCLINLAQSLQKNNFTDEAVVFLEFGIECNSDITNNYTLLAEYYNTNKQFKEMKLLKEKAAALSSIKKASILEKLESFSEL